MTGLTFSITITKEHAALIINGLNELKINAQILIEGIDGAYIQAVNQANAEQEAANKPIEVPNDEKPIEVEKEKVDGEK